MTSFRMKILMFWWVLGSLMSFSKASTKGGTSALGSSAHCYEKRIVILSKIRVMFFMHSCLFTWSNSRVF